MIADQPEQLAEPEVMWQSTLLQQKGILVVRGLLPPAALEALQQDLRQQQVHAKRCECTGPNEAEWRGGEPARALTTVPAGPLEWHVFGSEAMRSAISALCGIEVEATGAGVYSAYVEPGDFLGLHRDIRTCDIAVISCLEEEGPPIGQLRAYPAFASEPLSRVDRGKGVDIPLHPGDTAILAGGVVPHEVTPLAPGQRRAVAITCYRPRQ